MEKKLISMQCRIISDTLDTVELEYKAIIEVVNGIVIKATDRGSLTQDQFHILDENLKKLNTIWMTLNGKEEEFIALSEHIDRNAHDLIRQRLIDYLTTMGDSTVKLARFILLWPKENQQRVS